MNDKKDCIAAIKANLRKTADWRKTTIARRYPDDQRNLEAVETLTRLVDQTDGLTDEDWEALRPHFNWSSPRWISANNETSRMVGFRNRITNFDAYLDALESELAD